MNNSSAFFQKPLVVIALLVLAFSVLMSLAWPTMPLFFLAFIGLIPLFLLEAYCITGRFKRPGRVFFFSTWLALMLWNALTTWWIWHASPGGAVMAIVANSLLMTIPFALYRYTRKTIHQKAANWAFVLFWLALEYIHFNWSLNWPWISFGHVFASAPWIIQWYEFTGVLGGSLWVLLINLLIYHLLLSFYKTRERNITAIGLGVAFIFPIIFSLSLYSFNKDGEKATEILVLQPNIDPYEEKFAQGERFIPYDDQVRNMLALTEKHITPTTKLVLWPETAIQGNHCINYIDDDPIVQEIEAFVEKHAHVSMLVGMEAWGMYKDTTNLPEGVRYHPNVGYYDHFNSALFVTATGKEVYHKSKFVPGVEAVPFPAILGFVVKIIDFDGAGNYGSQEERTVFSAEGVKYAPFICYESIFGEFTGKYVANGADFLCIITNDGWWQNTAGHRHHNYYAGLRAIEHRRAVARSANTGISSFIDIYGNFIDQSKWWEETVLKTTLTTSTKTTFYTRYGDYIGKTAVLIAIFFMLSLIVRKKTKK